MYYIERGRIYQANLDGTGVETVDITGLRDPTSLALDGGAGKIYWTYEIGGGDDELGGIQRANLDGTGVEHLVTRLIPTDLALDLGGGKMYWVERGVIERANLDGTGAENLGISQVGDGLALDL